MALKMDGDVECWGNNSGGQCKVPSNLGRCIAIAAGFAHTAAITEKGTVVCWGLNIAGQCRVPRDIGPCVAVAAGTLHTVALQRGGTVVCWGAGDRPDHPRILKVLPGSAAEAAGLRAGDDVLAVLGTPVTNSAQLVSQLAARSGLATELLIRRESEQLVLVATPKADPSDKGARLGVEMGSSNSPGPEFDKIAGSICGQCMVPTNLGPCIAQGFRKTFLRR